MDEVQGRTEVVVMVMTMDMAPFREIFELGPNATWMRRMPASMTVIKYSGVPISRRRRPLSAVRERLRFLGPNKVDLGIAGRSTLLTRATDWLLRFAFPPRTRSRLVCSWGIRLFARALEFWQWAAGRVLWRRPASNGDARHAILVARQQTLSNMLDIQLAAFRRTVHEVDPDGFLVLTMSTYLVPDRMLAWHREAASRGVHFASMPSTFAGGRLFSGGCMYFSREGMQMLLAEERVLSRGVLNDVAITRWLRRTERSWEDLPTVSLIDESTQEWPCPLCDDPTIVAVRCTCHGNRPVELARMAALERHQDTHSGARRSTED